MDPQLQAHADWLRSSMPPWPFHTPLTVRCLVPAHFAAYARILHPIQSDHGPIRWHAHLAHSRPVIRGGHPVFPRFDDDPVYGPEDGDLGAANVGRLTEMLSTDPAQPVVAAVWNGFGVTHVPREVPTVEVPNREYHLTRQPIRAIPDLATATGWSEYRIRGPQLWWPEDRAWVVVSEIDLWWTYVGGSEALIRDILAEPAFEAARVQPDDSILDVPGVETPSLETP